MNAKTLSMLILIAAMAVGRAQEAQPAETARETEEQTIAKCLRDLKSDDVDARRRAAMIIGKYRTPMTEAAVIQCLRDPDRQVRQSALVSLTEERFLPAAARMDVFRLLLDADVHIRRLASAMIPEASGVMIRGPVQIRGNTIIQAGGNRSNDDNAEALLILNQALDDEDFSVRRNVLAAARYFPEPLEPERLVKFFKDDSKEVRALALAQYGRAPVPAEEAAKIIAPLADDPEPSVRLEVARLAGRYEKHGDDILAKLLEDKDVAVRVEAVRAYANHLNENAFEPLKKTILDENLPGDYRRLLLIPLRDYGEQSIPVFEGLLKGKNATLAVDAMNMLATNRAKMPPAFFVPYLDAQHEDIRKGAMRALNIMTRELSADDIRLIMKCKSHEGKMLGLRMSSRLQRDERLQLMQDACLDDDVEVRVYGLREIGLLKPEGWDEMLLASLEDPEEQIQQIAAEGLSRFPTEKIQNALREYLPNCKDIRVQRMIQRALARRPLQINAPPLR
ncbi:MAG: HEAT repeat domain-containing protein [Victivallales bacterium]|nr:HEAT repeat domain-containing protein [Victivallales bacterium]